MIQYATYLNFVSIYFILFSIRIDLATTSFVSGAQVHTHLFILLNQPPVANTQNDFTPM